MQVIFTKIIHAYFNTPKIIQVNLFSDGTFLSAYKLTDGSKLNLILKREAAIASSTTKSESSPRSSPAPVESVTPKVVTLEEELLISHL